MKRMLKETRSCFGGGYRRISRNNTISMIANKKSSLAFKYATATCFWLATTIPSLVTRAVRRLTSMSTKKSPSTQYEKISQPASAGRSKPIRNVTSTTDQTITKDTQRSHKTWNEPTGCAANGCQGVLVDACSKATIGGLPSLWEAIFSVARGHSRERSLCSFAVISLRAA